MAYLFNSPRLTLARAQYHIREFKEIVAEFIHSDPWTRFIDKKSQPGNKIYKIRFTRQLPEMLPCILFDAVSNLRAVLDQAGYAAAVASGKMDPKSTAFPFHDTLAGLDNQIVRRKVCADIPPDIVTLFRGFKPYKGGNDTLWALNKLCNAKKHCALIPAQISGGEANVFYPVRHAVAGGGFFEGDVIKTELTRWNPEKREMTLCPIPVGTKVKVESDFTFTVAIEGIEILRGQHATHVLRAMSNEVGNALRATEAKCLDLGFVLGKEG